MTREALSALVTLLEEFTDNEVIDAVMILTGGAANPSDASIRRLIKRLRRTLSIPPPSLEAEAEPAPTDQVEEDEKEEA